MKPIEHRDNLGYKLEVGTEVFYAQYGGISYGKITKLTPKGCTMGGGYNQQAGGVYVRHRTDNRPTHLEFLRRLGIDNQGYRKMPWQAQADLKAKWIKHLEDEYE